MRAALLAVLLMSCAAPSGRTYRDGAPVERAPVFVTPGYTPAGAGLPEYMPVHEAPTVERGKDRRVLPPTRGPGIWASDSREEFPADPVLLGVRLPFFYGASTDAEKAPTRECAHLMNLAVQMRRQSDTVQRMIPTQRACLAAQLYLACASGAERVDEASNHAHGPTHTELVRRISKAAEAFAAKMCRPSDMDDILHGVIGKVVPIWNQFAGVPEAQ